jgi:hypothetical protein
VQQVDQSGAGAGRDVGDLALAAGATVLGDPPHYLLTAEQLAAFVVLVAPLAVPAPPY